MNNVCSLGLGKDRHGDLAPALQAPPQSVMRRMCSCRVIVLRAGEIKIWKFIGHMTDSVLSL